MARCEDCLHYDLCEALERGNGIQKIHPTLCDHFKNKDEIEMAEKEQAEREKLKVFCPLLMASARGTLTCGENRCAWWVPGVRGKCAIKEIAEYIGCEGRGAGQE